MIRGCPSNLLPPAMHLGPPNQPCTRCRDVVCCFRFSCLTVYVSLDLFPRLVPPGMAAWHAASLHRRSRVSPRPRKRHTSEQTSHGHGRPDHHHSLVVLSIQGTSPGRREQTCQSWRSGGQIRRQGGAHRGRAGTHLPEPLGSSSWRPHARCLPLSRVPYALPSCARACSTAPFHGPLRPFSLPCFSFCSLPRRANQTQVSTARASGACVLAELRYCEPLERSVAPLSVCVGAVRTAPDPDL